MELFRLIIFLAPVAYATSLFPLIKFPGYPFPSPIWSPCFPLNSHVLCPHLEFPNLSSELRKPYSHVSVLFKSFLLQESPLAHHLTSKPKGILYASELTSPTILPP